MVGCIGERAAESPSMAILSEMKPRSALRLLRWVLLALALLTHGRASAQDAHPLDLDQTRAALSATEASLRDKNLTDADLQRLRSENDALGLALQGVIADLAPRLAASAKRLRELTPKSGETPPATDVAAKELASEKQRHDTLDANLRAARAMLLQADDLATRIGAARRQLFARETFARSSSVLNPQLWLAIWREAPIDADVVRSLIGNWLGGVADRLTLSQKIAMAAVAALIALIAAPLAWIARRIVHRDPEASPPSRLRRALAAAWTALVLALGPLIGLGLLANALDTFDVFDPSVQGLIDAALDAARALIVVNALGRGMLAPGLQPWRLIATSDRSAAIFYRLAMTIAAIWAAERLIEPAADAAASLNIAVAARAVGATLASLAMAQALHRLAGLPTLARGAGARRRLDAGQNPRLGVRLRHFGSGAGRLHRLRHLSHQSGDLPHRPRQRALPRRYHRSGWRRSAAEARGAGWSMGPRDGRPAPQRARPDRRRFSRGRAPRRAGRRGRGRSRAMGRAVAGHVRRAARGLFRLLGRRRHPVAVIDDRRRGGVRRRALHHAGDPGLAWIAAVAPDPPRRRRQQLGQDDFRLCRRDRRGPARWRANWPRRPEACADRRRPLGRHRLRPANDRQQFRFRPHPACGSAAFASGTGWWWETNRDSCTASKLARPRSKPSIAAL